MGFQDQAELLGKILLAALCGAFIGWQRDRRRYSAGLRTMALVAMGAALFSASNQAIGVDRIASNIVTGIGFIGAGIIFRDGAGVRGITTAATVWTVAAIGLAITLDLYLIALVMTPVVFLILEMRPVSEYISGRRPDLPLPPALRPHDFTSADDEDEARGRRHEEDEFS